MKKTPIFAAVALSFFTQIAIGQVEVGVSAQAMNMATAVGDNSFANNQSTSLGDSATSNGENSVAIGNASFDGDRNNVVSVGNDNIKRVIINVGDGAVSAGSDEAVTGSQLYGVSQRSDEAHTIATNSMRSANSAHDRINDLDTRLTNGLADVKRNAEAATAAAIAIPSTPSNIPVGKIWAGAAIGSYGGSTAGGVAAAYQLSDKINLSAGIAKGNNSKTATRVQAGFLF